jgi:hypothetical protein
MGLALALCGLIVAGCGPRALDVAGVWQGSWTSTDHESTGTFRVDISQRGRAISGPIELSLDWLPQAQIKGIVEGANVRWGVLHGGVTLLTFEGTVTEDAAAGRYSIGTGGDGVWTARRVRRPR